MFYQPKKCSRATLRYLAGRMWPAGRTLPRPSLADSGKTTLLHNRGIERLSSLNVTVIVQKYSIHDMLKIQLSLRFFWHDFYLFLCPRACCSWRWGTGHVLCRWGSPWWARAWRCARGRCASTYREPNGSPETFFESQTESCCDLNWAENRWIGFLDSKIVCFLIKEKIN